MQGDNTVHNQKVRDVVGNKKVHATPAKQEGGVASYKILSISGPWTEWVLGPYINLIYSKWLRSFRYGNDYIKLTDSESYYVNYHRYITTLLQKPETTIRLAVLTDDADVVLGFSVSRGNILDYVHVHKDNRRIGIGTKLIPPGIDTFTHCTKTWLSIWNDKYKDWKFNLFA
jgi:hypothetical protein